MKNHVIRRSMTNGVVSPWLDARADFGKYDSSLRIGENMLLRSQGPGYKRPGMVFIGRAKDGQQTRLMEFNFDTSTRFQFAFANNSLRFWSNDLPVTLAFTRAAAWSGTTSEYPVGTIVANSNAWYACKTAHTPTSGNQPPGTNWNAFNVAVWQATTVYAAGDIVSITGAVYNGVFICFTGHTSGSSPDLTKFAPIGYNAVYPYQANNDTKQIGYWNAGINFTVGRYVLNQIGDNFRYFRCKLAHTSAASTQPGVGSSWSTYWTEYSTIPTHNTASFAYKAGDQVRVGSDLYIAKSDHTSSTSNEPLDAGSPWKKINGVAAWTGTSTARANGDCVFGSGMFLACAAPYTSGAYAYTTTTVSRWNQLKEAIRMGTTWSASPAYNVNEVVNNGTNKALYICVQEHSTASTTEPGTTGGSSYWQKLHNIFVLQSGVSYTKGQYVIDASNGDTYIAVVDFTATSSVLADELLANNIESAEYQYEVETPWTEEQVFDIDYLQVNDTVRLLHKDVEEYLLTRFADTAWKLAPLEYSSPPMRDENIDEAHTMTLSDATVGTGRTLTSSRPVFNPSHVGGYFWIGHRRETASVKLALNATGESSALRISGRWDIYIYGTDWVGNVTLMMSKDGSTNWQALRNWEQPVANMRTVATNGILDEEMFLKIKFTRTAGTTASYAWLEAADSRVNGLVRVTSVQSPTTAICDVKKACWNTTATTAWAEGAYSGYRGFPCAATMFEGRVILAGAKAEPQRLRFSTVDEFTDFGDGTTDASAFSVQIAARKANAIQWLVPMAKTLVVGTVGEEFIVTRSTDSKIISIANPPAITPVSEWGSCSIRAIKAGDVVIHVQSNKMRIREFSQDASFGAINSVDLNELAEHLTTSGIKQIAVSKQPDMIIWVVLNNGKLLSLTYNRKQDVVGWMVHSTDGDFESICVTYGGVNTMDEIWFIVRRSINGEYIYCYEKLYQYNDDKLRPPSGPIPAASLNLLVYCDSAVLFPSSGVPHSTLSGLTHLALKDVVVLADGVVLEDTFTVAADGTLALGAAYNTVVVGLPFTAQVQWMRLEMNTPLGTAQSSTFKVSNVVLRTAYSAGFEAHYNPEDTSVEWQKAGGDLTDLAARTQLPTDFKVPLNNRGSDNVRLTIRSSVPLPLNILSAINITEVNE